MNLTLLIFEYAVNCSSLKDRSVLFARQYLPVRICEELLRLGVSHQVQRPLLLFLFQALLPLQPVSMEATGKYDFNPTTEDDLTFRKGDVMKILSVNEGWCKAEMHGLEGYVPQNYVDMQTPSWFKEDASRSSAEELLKNKNVGRFLIRGCQSSPGDFSISVKHESDVQHFKVMKDNKGQYFLWNDRFTSLNKLVEFYKTNSISKQREIYLDDGSQDMKYPSPAQPLKRGSLPEKRSCSNMAATGATQRRASDQPISQLIKRAEERSNTFGGRTGRDSPVFSATVPRRPSETMPIPQRAAATLVKAMYDFTAEEDDELGFITGEVVEVLDRSDELWWKGRLRGKIGLFPANYTSQI